MFTPAYSDGTVILKGHTGLILADAGLVYHIHYKAPSSNLLTRDRLTEAVLEVRRGKARNSDASQYAYPRGRSNLPKFWCLT